MRLAPEQELSSCCPDDQALEQAPRRAACVGLWAPVLGSQVGCFSAVTSSPCWRDTLLPPSRFCMGAGGPPRAPTLGPALSDARPTVACLLGKRSTLATGAQRCGLRARTVRGGTPHTHTAARMGWRRYSEAVRHYASAGGPSASGRQRSCACGVPRACAPAWAASSDDGAQPSPNRLSVRGKRSSYSSNAPAARCWWCCSSRAVGAGGLPASSARVRMGTNATRPGHHLASTARRGIAGAPNRAQLHQQDVQGD